MGQPSWIGYTIGGRYKIDRLLGQGGMSAVYQANDPNLRRSVAIKLIHAHLSSDPEFVKRFEEEAAAVAQLRHPNIIQVYDFNQDNGTFYMVLEFVQGETLQARLKNLSVAGKKMLLADTIRLMVKICDAAGYAHARGMIHRDLKPANVMLNPQGEPILMDFGVAKIKGGQMHTATGAIVGTPLYMSPEQARGEKLDARTDLYALGIILYEMAVGQPPFEADSAMSIMLKHLNEPVPDISPLVGAESPPELKAIIEKALAKDPAQRFHSAEEMAQALRVVGAQLAGATLAGQTASSLTAATASPLIAGAGLTSAPTTPGQVPTLSGPATRTDSGQRRNPPWLWAGLAGLLCLVGGVVLAVTVILPPLSKTPTPEPPTQVVVLATTAPAIENTATASAPTATPIPAVTDTVEPSPTPIPPTATEEPSPTPIPVPEGMALIPGDTFTMGSTNRSDETPEHQVTLSDFYMDLFEVSNARYTLCVDAGVCAAPARRGSFTRGSYFDNPDFANYPVVFVTWEQADAFCAFEGKRLPTEAEWEYAAGGPDELQWPWGNTFEAALSAASAGDTQPVDAYPDGVSPFGMHNMAGNVAEWVADRYGTYPSDPQTDPTGPETGNARVYRGGSFGNTDRTFYTTTRRYNQGQRFFVEDIGFRCAADAP